MVDETDRSADEPTHDEMAEAALRGLFAGDLSALVRYLRSDFPIHPVVRRSVADLIDGVEGLPYRMAAVGDGRAAQKLNSVLLDLAITRHVSGYERREGKGRESAVTDAAATFGLSKRKVWDALSRAKSGRGTASR